MLPFCDSLSPGRTMAQYQREFGFVLEDRVIIVDDTRVRATGRAVDLPQAEHIGADPGAVPLKGAVGQRAHHLRQLLLIAGSAMP